MTNKNDEVKERRTKKSISKQIAANPYTEKLVSFGLSESEALIYLTLLQFGKELGGTKLALLADLHRQYVYLALPKLINSNLVEEVGDGKHKKYKARPPSELEKIGRRKALEAGDLARELNLISNIGNEQEFEVLQGKKAIQEYEMQHALRAHDESEEYILGGASELFSSLMGDEMEEYLDSKTKKNIGVKYIGTKDEEESYKKYIGVYENQEYRFMEKLPKGKTHMVIRLDTVSFYSFLNPPLVYVVKSKEVAQNYKAFFMMLWEMAK